MMSEIKRDTAYATELASARDVHGQRIERLYIKGYERDEIRFSWWPDGKMANRPLDIPEDELLLLFKAAVGQKVFAAEFLRDLHKFLNDTLRPA